jgi:hypothetical protein
LEKIYTYFNNPGKVYNCPSKNFKGETIKIHLFYDLSYLTLSSYYAVILRNLPQNTNNEDVKHYCHNRTSGVINALYPKKIENSYCSVVTFKELDDAEKLCIHIKNEQTDPKKERKIKANLHPKCCRIRRKAEKSHFAKILYKKDKIKFSEKVKKSEMSISKSVPFTKIFAPKESEKKVEVKKEDSKLPENKTVLERSLEISSLHTLLKLQEVKNESSENKVVNTGNISDSKTKTSGMQNLTNLLLLVTKKNQSDNKESMDTSVSENLSNTPSLLTQTTNISGQLNISSIKEDSINKPQCGQVSQLPSQENNGLILSQNQSEEMMHVDPPILTEKEVIYYTYNFKDEQYFKTPKEDKRNKKEEQSIYTKNYVKNDRKYKESNAYSKNHYNIAQHESHRTNYSSHYNSYNDRRYSNKEHYFGPKNYDKKHNSNHVNLNLTNIISHTQGNMKNIVPKGNELTYDKLPLSAVIKPPDEDKLPPLPEIEQNKKEDKIEPGQILSEEEKVKRRSSISSNSSFVKFRGGFERKKRSPKKEKRDLKFLEKHSDKNYDKQEKDRRNRRYSRSRSRSKSFRSRSRSYSRDKSTFL